MKKFHSTLFFSYKYKYFRFLLIYIFVGDFGTPSIAIKCFLGIEEVCPCTCFMFLLAEWVWVKALSKIQLVTVWMSGYCLCQQEKWFYVIKSIVCDKIPHFASNVSSVLIQLPFTKLTVFMFLFECSAVENWELLFYSQIEMKQCWNAV